MVNLKPHCNATRSPNKRKKIYIAKFSRKRDLFYTRQKSGFDGFANFLNQTKRLPDCYSNVDSYNTWIILSSPKQTIYSPELNLIRFVYVNPFYFVPKDVSRHY